MARSKTVQFLCKVCKKPVYRLGKSVNEAKQLCGKHAKINTAIALDIKPSDVVQLQPDMDIKGKIAYYRQRLDKVEAIVLQYEGKEPLSFIDVWRKTE